MASTLSVGNLTRSPCLTPPKDTKFQKVYSCISRKPFLFGNSLHRKYFHENKLKAFLPVDPWNPSSVDSQSVASSLFAFSLLPYLGFLYYLTKSKTAPKLTLFGFYFLLAFVGATIPAGIYAKIHYGTSLSNVDYLHGGAESLLTITNLFIVLGLRQALRESESEPNATESQSKEASEDSN